MRKVEARRWILGKETFDQYAKDKMALMNRLDLSVKDTIHLLIGGITNGSLHGMALLARAETVEAFLEIMRQVTEGYVDQKKRRTGVSGAASGTPKDKDAACRNCGVKGHTHMECKGQTFCFYCKEKGHRRYDCPVLRQKGSAPKARAASPATAQTAASVATDPQSSGAVAAVSEVHGVHEVGSLLCMTITRFRCTFETRPFMPMRQGDLRMRSASKFARS